MYNECTIYEKINNIIIYNSYYKMWYVDRNYINDSLYNYIKFYDYIVIL